MKNGRNRAGEPGEKALKFVEPWLRAKKLPSMPRVCSSSNHQPARSRPPERASPPPTVLLPNSTVVPAPLSDPVIWPGVLSMTAGAGAVVTRAGTRCPRVHHSKYSPLTHNRFRGVPQQSFRQKAPAPSGLCVQQGSQEQGSHPRQVAPATGTRRGAGSTSAGCLTGGLSISSGPAGNSLGPSPFWARNTMGTSASAVLVYEARRNPSGATGGSALRGIGAPKVTAGPVLADGAALRAGRTAGFGALPDAGAACHWTSSPRACVTASPNANPRPGSQARLTRLPHTRRRIRQSSLGVRRGPGRGTRAPSMGLYGEALCAGG